MERSKPVCRGSSFRSGSTGSSYTNALADYWLTRPEVAERLKVPYKTLDQWASQNKGR
jgi:hypothetical protein